MRNESSISRTLRSTVWSELSRKFFATCWVMVEAPCMLPVVTLFTTARPRPITSMPGWL